VVPKAVGLLWLLATVAHACDCIALPASQAKRYSEIVFRGTVAEFLHNDKGETRAVFHVSRVWKGPVTANFQMLAVEGDACFAFYPSLLKPGNEVLVYAHRMGDSEYFPMPCNTSAVQNAKEQIRSLGAGRKPRSK
jgi:hypothetical protein